MVASGKLNEWVHLIFANVRAGTVINCIKNLHPILETIVTYIYQHGPVKAKRVTHWNFTKDRMDRRTELDNPSRQDLWSAVIKSSGRPGGLTLDEQHSNASIFMIAGTETVRSTILSSHLFCPDYGPSPPLPPFPPSPLPSRENRRERKRTEERRRTNGN